MGVQLPSLPQLRPSVLPTWNPRSGNNAARSAVSVVPHLHPEERRQGLIAFFKDVPGDVDVHFWQHIGAMNEPFKDEEPVTLQIGKYDSQVENEFTYEEIKTF
ncbi:hypothetical protein FHG87_021593 [Trinorchestia longiramus]|nr:hypothetical protein FHG87_021593 [Trinorchestia longiramus]